MEHFLFRILFFITEKGDSSKPFTLQYKQKTNSTFLLIELQTDKIILPSIISLFIPRLPDYTHPP